MLPEGWGCLAPGSSWTCQARFGGSWPSSVCRGAALLGAAGLVAHRKGCDIHEKLLPGAARLSISLLEAELASGRRTSPLCGGMSWSWGRCCLIGDNPTAMEPAWFTCVDCWLEA